MVENENSPPQSDNTAEEVAEVIQQFEQYRERLVTETIAAAQKAKFPQKSAMNRIEPELQQIDTSLENLRTQLAALTASN
jgi:hypothetical protein